MEKEVFLNRERISTLKILVGMSPEDYCRVAKTANRIYSLPTPRASILASCGCIAIKSLWWRINGLNVFDFAREFVNFSCRHKKIESEKEKREVFFSASWHNLLFISTCDMCEFLYLDLENQVVWQFKNELI